MTIEEWAEKGFNIGIFPIIHSHRIEWTAGVIIGKNNKMTWMNTKGDNCSFSSFLTYTDALNAAIKFCETYKPKKHG